MNEQNYCTQPASKRLLDAGIVLKTEVSWVRVNKRKEWILRHEAYLYESTEEAIPAPSLAEVWRELPEEITYKGLICYLNMEKGCAGYMWFDSYQKYFGCTDPTDALIDLLIWVRSQKRKVEGKLDPVIDKDSNAYGDN